MARGLRTLVLETQRRQSLPVIQFVSGRGTTLAALAELAADSARAKVEIVEAPPRSYGVEHFVGNPRRARELLGWEARVPLRNGMERLVSDYVAADVAAKVELEMTSPAA